MLSQCNGCNDEFYPIDMWNLKNPCNDNIKTYSECNTPHLFNSISNQYDIQIPEIGSQKWVDNNLIYFYLYDNRFILTNDDFKSVLDTEFLFLDGINVNLRDTLYSVNSKYVLLRQNNIDISMKNISFSEESMYISLDDNKFYGSIPESIFKNKNLINLSIEFNNIFGQLPQNINDAINLKSLILNNNKISGFIPESICDLKEIKIIHLQYNSIFQIPDCICDMVKNGVEIELYGNIICSNIPNCAKNLIGFQECF